MLGINALPNVLLHFGHCSGPEEPLNISIPKPFPSVCQHPPLSPRLLNASEGFLFPSLLLSDYREGKVGMRGTWESGYSARLLELGNEVEVAAHNILDRCTPIARFESESVLSSIQAPVAIKLPGLFVPKPLGYS